MSAEIREVTEFLARHEPFSRLPDSKIAALGGELSIQYYRRGETLLEIGFDNRHLFLVRQGAVELRNPQGGLMARLSVGECFGNLSLVAGIQSPKKVTALEDTLVYLLPGALFQELRTSYSEFDLYFNQLDNDRMQRAVRRLQGLEERSGEAMFMRTVAGDLVKRPAVSGPTSLSIREAAERMHAERATSILIMDNTTLLGILTDRDLRGRVVAQGLNPDAPVVDVMTRDPLRADIDTPAFEVLLRMTERNIHHMPIFDGGELKGLLSTNDIMAHKNSDSVYLVGKALQQNTVQGLTEVAELIPGMLQRLIEAMAGARDIGRVIAGLTDAITRRLLELAEAELGPPPCRYTWLVFGSQGRREQSVHSDQDNALLISDQYSPEEHSAYFEHLARFVCDGLNACSYDYCPGEIMATNERWRRPLQDWKNYFRDWITDPQPEALLRTAIFFDLRSVYGAAELSEELTAEIRKWVVGNQVFSTQMAKNALSHQPPIGFFRRFVVDHEGEHRNSFDLKYRGVRPIVDLVRVYALASGCQNVGTPDRVEAAVEAEELSSSGGANLVEAWAFISAVRYRHQARLLAAGRPVDNRLEPDALSSFERHHLKDAFQIVRRMQANLSQRYHLGNLG